MRSFSGCVSRQRSQPWGGEGGARAAYLVTGVHVEASPEAMVPAAIFHVVAVLSGHGQSGGGRVSRVVVCGSAAWLGQCRAHCRRGCRGSHRAGRSSTLTHSMSSCSLERAAVAGQPQGRKKGAAGGGFGSMLVVGGCRDWGGGCLGRGAGADHGTRAHWGFTCRCGRWAAVCRRAGEADEGGAEQSRAESGRRRCRTVGAEEREGEREGEGEGADSRIGDGLPASVAVAVAVAAAEAAAAAGGWMCLGTQAEGGRDLNLSL